MITADVKLQARLPPNMLDDTPKRVKVEGGGRAELTCNAGGFPKPTMKWTREDNLPLPAGKDSVVANPFVIESARMEDRGERETMLIGEKGFKLLFVGNYVCLAENGVGDGQSRIVSLEVEFAPRIAVPRPRVPQAAGYDVELECLITAFPPPAIKWTKGNDSVTNGDTRQISHFALQQDVTRSTLKV